MQADVDTGMGGTWKTDEKCCDCLMESSQNTLWVLGVLVRVTGDLNLSPTELRKQVELGVFLVRDFSYIWTCSWVKNNF